jgi:hypothetical protein
MPREPESMTALLGITVPLPVARRPERIGPSRLVPGSYVPETTLQSSRMLTTVQECPLACSPES